MARMSFTVATKIRTLRKSKGLTQETLAIRCGLSRSYISLLESGKKIPAVATLARIADALGVKVGALFEDDEFYVEPSIISVTKQHVQNLFQSVTDDYMAYLYIPLIKDKRQKIMDPFVIKVMPGPKKTKPFIHKGQEFNYILSGKLKFTYGKEEYILLEGDSLYCDSSMPHTMEALDDQPVLLISVVAAEALESKIAASYKKTNS